MEFRLFCAFLFLFSVINFDVSTGRVHKKDVHSRDLGNDLGSFLDALASFFGNNHENDIEGNQVGEPEPEEPEPEPVPEPEEPEPESECRDGWILGPSKSCYYISPDLKTGTFYDAKRECENLDSDVISIHSASEQMFLDDLLGNHPDLLNPLRKTDFWTSGNQLGRTDNDWQWGDDENDVLSKGYTNWDIANGQPNSPYEKCIFLGHYNRFGLEWHDHRCSYNLATFICETKLAGHENDIEGNQVGEPEPEEPEPEPVPEPEEPEPESECRLNDGWILGPSKSCYYLSPDLKKGTFYDAKRECEKLDSDVISIDSASEQRFLEDVLGSPWLENPNLSNPLRNTDFWTSGNQLGRSDNDWQWGDDENDVLSKGYTNWDVANGQPNSPYEKCIFLGHYNRFGLRWHDHRCSYNLASFICETKLAGHENDEEENGGDSIDDEDLHQGSGSGSESGSGSGPEAGWIDDNDNYY